MDLIAKVRRCFNCLHWKSPDPSDRLGRCNAPPPQKVPFWMKTPAPGWITTHSDGTDCPAYAHGGRHKPHPLDDSPRVTMVVCKGDTLPMRTYPEGTDTYSEADATVVGYGKNHLVVDLFNVRHHVRIAASARHRAGTVIGVEEWGVDLARPIRRSGRPVGDLAGAEAFLARVKKGMRIPLTGLPPFDGVQKVAYVVANRRDDLVIRVGNAGKRLTMAATGPLAGMVVNDPLWMLDMAAVSESTNKQR